jgi:phage N-6-adenine-methyltransferase
MNPIHFSSKTDLWATPQWMFDQCNDELGPFELDACADAINAKCDRFYDEATNGLNQDWSPFKTWMNPPYGREIGKWVKKAYEESQKGSLVVCLLPARTDTKWWHDYAMRGEVRFLRGRLKFGNAIHSAPFPNALVIFRPRSANSEAILAQVSEMITKVQRGEIGTQPTILHDEATKSYRVIK